jgi:hypothetical protein
MSVSRITFQIISSKPLRNPILIPLISLNLLRNKVLGPNNPIRKILVIKTR